ncbi:helix-turn-helix domain-containing protein [Micromonospora sp. S4605]|uniref:helix-turn-helix domain-containing protein n=1 Tax=Micromonospora sp. S4605 TaxID=1420897 RepID=UPI0013050C34|nr:helix-turn-helix transcriptional regulator [Micromonospora sp. S4605]
MASNQDHPTAVIAQQVRALRKRDGLTAEQLAARMREQGVPFDKTVVANLETGRRRFVTVQELFALAEVFDVFPVHLLVPPDSPDDDSYQVTPDGPVSTLHRVRQWIRGQSPLRGFDDAARTIRHFSRVPRDEAEAFLLRDIGRGLSRVVPTGSDRDHRDDDDVTGVDDDGRR